MGVEGLRQENRAIETAAIGVSAFKSPTGLRCWRVRKFPRLAILFVAVAGLAGAGDQAARFNDLGHQLMCICGCNQILLECNHVGCPDSDGMRNELAAALTRGESDSLVVQSFVQKYGPTVLAAPPTTGFSRAAWIVPFAALGIGVFTVVVVVRNWKNRPPSPPADGGSPTRSGGGPPVSSAELERFREQARKETDL